MEKKNTILLTVIAIATLLVAVVGATFAYFTAQVQTTNNDNATTTVNTATLASASMDMGDSITSSDIYPGARVTKYVDVTGTCADGSTNCTAIPTNITVTQTIPTEFGSDISWKLYKVAANKEIGCKNEIVASQAENATSTSEDGQTTTTTVQYKMTPTCKVGISQAEADALNVTDTGWTSITEELTDANIATTLGEPVLTSASVASNVATLPVSVDGNTNDRYYLVVDYANNATAHQNGQQTKQFTIKLGFDATQR